MVQRLDPSTLATTAEATPDSIRRFIEADFHIRSGLCPNGHGLMAPIEYGQQCPFCHFATNTLAEPGTAQ